jgi:cardiolipin synthase (CMP-forming)
VQVEIRPTSLGKLTTLTQLLTVLLALSSSLFHVSPWDSLVVGITAMLSIASGVHYVRKGMNMMQSRQPQRGTIR